ncbi:GNAT family N-acetyltransferase [Blastococcus brunescens]|uniref:GNAT family N-acetyltransferase n=1 Tax=Blastococcus brunescens TaxID=1564165 RepID=A0ABZ1B5G8_9ACTN|nr:GNAT family N-acetyltransferase [Blastococcus sp. BMG 8361]WRL66057.1 GNAT family N-acetyltransferase [Blastococcus sp. BMG 8361]
MHEALTIYGLAMGYDSAVVAGRYGYAVQHTERPGFRAVGAFAETGAGGGETAERLVGFGYGYVVAPGQWWHDQVRAALDRRTAKRWLPDAFEVCELHVHPDHQSRGLGRRLLHALVTDIPHPAALLSTPDADTKAFRLYHADGFVDLARGYHFPGDSRPFAILGARLPSVPANRCIRTTRTGRTAERERSPADTRVDVVVIGSGHNGLVAACYLARAGLSVEVVESDAVLGGAVSTVERWPGVLVDRGSSAHVIIRQSGIVEELDLAAHGLRYIDCDPWGFAPAPSPGTDGPDGRPLVFSVDLDATCASIAEACGSEDAEAYRRFVEVWGPRSRAVAASFGRSPTAAGLLRSFWPLGAPADGRPRTPGGELAVDFLGSGDALLDRWFGSERLKAALAWFGAQSGPPMSEPGTAAMVAWFALLHDVPPGHPVGGSGGLTAALRHRLESDGGRVVLGDGAAQLLTADDGAGGRRITGVRTVGGRRIEADAVVAACHVLVTRSWPGSTHHRPSPTPTRRSATASGWSSARSPTHPGLPRRRPRTGAPGAPAALHRPRGARLRARRLGRRAAPALPVPLAMCFSASDDTLAPPGQHVVTIWGQWYPYALADGADWDTLAESEAQRLVAAVDRYAPGFADSVQRLHVQTPLALERELSLLRGNVMHVEMGLASMFAFRPTPALSGYAVPGLSGLYLAGASTHPGGGVSGNSGRTSARVLLADRRALPRARATTGRALRRAVTRMRRTSS